jgi:hypothetical protein
LHKDWHRNFNTVDDVGEHKAICNTTLGCESGLSVEMIDEKHSQFKAKTKAPHTYLCKFAEKLTL